MTVLNTLYASGGDVPIIRTLQIDIDSGTYWLTQGYDDITATLESGQTVTFIASALDVALPARNADGTQDLKFAISNVDGIVSSAIRDALDNEEIGTLTFRTFTGGDLSAPAAPPFTLTIKGGYWKATEVQTTAGYMNILDTAYPRRRYNLVEHSGLRYIS